TVDPSLDDNVADPQSPAPQAGPDEDHQPEPEPAPAPRAESPPPPQEPEPARPEAAPTAVNNDALGVVHPHARLNPNYTFETFVIGASNRFAHAAATAFAADPARAYNHLYISWTSGYGNTHPLQVL